MARIITIILGAIITFLGAFVTYDYFRGAEIMADAVFETGSFVNFYIDFLLIGLGFICTGLALIIEGAKKD